MAKAKRSRIYALILAATMAVTQFGIQKPTSAASSFNYGEALQKSILFYEAQRSGSLSTSDIPTRITWRGDSQLTDGKKEGIDLTGGWVDAGDNIKFGITCAYSAGLLAYGAIQYKDAYVKSGQMKWLQNQLRWVNDYFIKCHTAKNEYWAQVGMTAKDHNNWMPIEVTHITNDRAAIKIDATNPGTEVAMDTAAAMAASSIVFRDSDPTYADKLMTHAKELYEFGDTYRGKFSDTIYKIDPQGAAAYTSYSGYADELVWGSIWLYKGMEAQKAGSGSSYLAKAKEYYNGIGKQANQSVHKYQWAHCWDDQSYGSYVLMSQIEPTNAEYSQDTERWLNWWTVGGTEYNADGTKVPYTPGGHARLDRWGSLRYASTTALFAFAYSDNLADATKKARYHDFAVNQMNYILGDNPRNASYVVGFGDDYPQHPHHRTAQSSYGQTMDVPSEHRHILYGALVGSPTATDGFNDVVSDYEANEVAIDYNAGFTGALAKMYSEFGGNPIADSSFPLPDKPYSEKDEFPVFAKTYFESSSGTQFSLTVENRSAWPARVTNDLKVRYFFTLDANDISDISIDSPKWSNVSGPTVWDEANKVYYFTIDLSGTNIYPGYGWEVGGPEVDFTIRSKSNQWNVTNDWSYKGWDKTYASGTRSYAPNFVVYEGDNFKRLAGNEPPGGTSSQTTMLTPIYPTGKTYYGTTDVVKVKLTDFTGKALAGQTVKFSMESLGAVHMEPATSVTDSNGIASTKLYQIAPAGDGYMIEPEDGYVIATFDGGTNNEPSTCKCRVYSEGTQKLERVLTPLYPAGQTYFGTSGYSALVKVKLTDEKGYPVSDAEIQWSIKHTKATYALEYAKTSKTDSNGIATADISIIVLPGENGVTEIVEGDVTADYIGDYHIADATCTARLYGEVGSGYILGDINSDGSVDAIDFAILKKYLLDSSIQINVVCADMNKDGNIDAIDFALLKKMLLN